MVTDGNVERAREVIESWAANLPQGSVQISETSLRFEHVFAIEPKAARASPLELRIGRRDNAFDVGVGRGSQFNDIPFDEELLREVLA